MGVLTLVSAHALPIHLSPHKHEWTFLAHVSATPHLGISPQAQSSDSHYNALGQHRCFAGTYCYLWVRSCPHVLLPLHLWSILTLIFILNYDYKPSILYWFWVVCLFIHCMLTSSQTRDHKRIQASSYPSTIGIMVYIKYNNNFILHMSFGFIPIHSRHNRWMHFAANAADPTFVWFQIWRI